MKHARKDYDRIQNPAALIAEDEPVFLLRAKDLIAARTVQYWASEVEKAGGDSTTVRLARLQANRMLGWGLHHGSKTPDVPDNTCDDCGRTFSEGEELRHHRAEPCEW